MICALKVNETIITTAFMILWFYLEISKYSLFYLDLAFGFRLDGIDEVDREIEWDRERKRRKRERERERERERGGGGESKRSL